MNSIAACVLLFTVAVNAAVLPEYRSSVVMSERDGNNFAYTVHDQQGMIQHSQAMMGKQLAYSRTLPEQLSMIDSRQYVVAAPGGLAQVPAMSHLYGGAYPAARYGMSAYGVQPITYAGQPFLMGHQPLITDVARAQLVAQQVKA